jgi:hypothetical protein
MTFLKRLELILPESVKKGGYPVTPIGIDLSLAKQMFDLYNENRGEITGDPNIKRETSYHCSACVGRVVNRLKKYYDANK